MDLPARTSDTNSHPTATPTIAVLLPGSKAPIPVPIGQPQGDRPDILVALQKRGKRWPAQVPIDTSALIPPATSSHKKEGPPRVFQPAHPSVNANPPVVPAGPDLPLDANLEPSPCDDWQLHIGQAAQSQSKVRYLNISHL